MWVLRDATQKEGWDPAGERGAQWKIWETFVQSQRNITFLLETVLQPLGLF